RLWKRETPITARNASSAKCWRMSWRCRHARCSENGAITAAATSQRQKLSATGSNSSRSARPRIQFPDHIRLAAASSANAPARPANGLLRGGRERRQLADVARVVLDDDRALQVLLDLLDALDRGDGLRAVVVEAGHAFVLIVLAHVHRVADQQH